MTVLYRIATREHSRTRFHDRKHDDANWTVTMERTTADQAGSSLGYTGTDHGFPVVPPTLRYRICNSI